MRSEEFAIPPWFSPFETPMIYCRVITVPSFSGFWDKTKKELPSRQLLVDDTDPVQA